MNARSTIPNAAMPSGGNVDEAGNFSIQVLSEAVSRMFNVSLVDTRQEDVRPLMRDPASSAEGFVINRHAQFKPHKDSKLGLVLTGESGPPTISEAKESEPGVRVT